MHALLGQGMGIKAIVRKLSLARETVRRFTRATHIEELLAVPLAERVSILMEGAVNRINMIKRQMYGRANFDLLRQRVLLAT